ncbi:ResIII-domain-containing protein [Wallemia mellicola]|uniref:ResIII-domain-containing protein n=1 Tax=Wallemia mellicola TaxID=1708541 RepID=A0AB74KE47_9BASI|nr:ResIII-domain-containing protein [Wallemia mellicola]
MRRYSNLADKIKLRPYQEAAITSVMDALTRPDNAKSRLGVSSPTGSGKTTMFVELAQRLKKPGKVLVLVNGIELARQAQQAFIRGWPDVSVDIDQGPNVASGDADVTIATFQTLIRPGKLDKYNPEDYKVVLVDEAHHAAAQSYVNILAHFDSRINGDQDGHQVPIVGFSATFSRHDSLALGKVFEEIVFHKDFLDMIKEQWLSNVTFTTIKTDIDLSQVKISERTNDYIVTSLSPILNTPSVRRVVLAAYLDKCSDRRSTLIFCADIKHLHNLTMDFRDAAIDARFIYSGTPAKEREKILNDFKSFKFPVLMNCAVLTEGADIPNIDCILLCRPTRSRNLFSQMIGRGMRVAEGKTECKIIDIAASLDKVGDISAAPSLEGLDLSLFDDINSETIENDVKDHLLEHPLFKEDPTTIVPHADHIIFTDYDDPRALFASLKNKHSENLYNLSRNAWVDCRGGYFVLSCQQSGEIRIEHIGSEYMRPVQIKANKNPDGKYLATHKPANVPFRDAKAAGLSPFRRIVTLVKDVDFDMAIKASDKFANEKLMRGRSTLILRDAPWRKSPATNVQLNTLEKRLKGDLNEDMRKRLSKGDAADMITRLMNGYKRRAEKQQKQAMKEHKEAEKKRNKMVKVGPLL